MRTGSINLNRHEFHVPAQPPAIRADQPLVVEVAPEVANTLVIAAGAIFMTLAGACLALYLMLPFRRLIKRATSHRRR